jgi:hypothetical protein
MAVGLLLASCTPELPEEVASAYEKLPQKVDFNFHVRPILSDRCYSCHGPDEQGREADLRLDLEESAFAALSSGEGYAFVAGKPGKSLAIQRILSQDPELAMPPPEAHLDLTEAEKAILVKWVEQGARWKQHWAFIPAQKPSLPKVKNKEWIVQNPIDPFIYKRLAEQGLRPSPEADKERLLRRVTMDLTGLPPTIESIDAFLADNRPDAYERIVDSLLQTDACAERLALDWLDLARYADSHGMHSDGYRLMWPWRDWVIKAFQQNTPYDQFVSWQLAGDLLPNATQEQKLATAFNRNHPMSAEAGIVDEEYRLLYVFDRAETVGTAFMGLTMNCARCHDHKFDPVSQKEYYQLTAFFNNLREQGMNANDGNYSPLLPLTTPATEEKLDSLRKVIRVKEQELEATKEQLAETTDFIQSLPPDFRPPGQVGYYPLEKLRKEKEHRYIADGNKDSFSPGQPRIVEGKVGNAFEFTGEYDELRLNDLENYEWTQPLSATLWVNTTKRKKDKTQTLIGNAGPKNNFWRGWEFYLDTLNRLNIRLTSALPGNCIHLTSRDSIHVRQWTHVGFTYDGSGRAGGLRLYVDGQSAAATIAYDHLYKSIQTRTGRENVLQKRAVLVGKSYRGGNGDNGLFQGRIDDIQFFERRLTPLEMALVAGAAAPDPFLSKDSESGEQLREYWLSQHPQVLEREKALQDLRGAWLSAIDTVPEVMIMQEMPEMRPTFAYRRGDYTAPMYKVQAATPGVLPPLPADYPRNRLGLAQWLFDPEHPLTARVTVNRYWQMLFGKGLVKTPHDFGVQGALPSHPALLDWLAVYFVENNWDVKKLLKLMVTSHTYRQSSATNQLLQERDPDNTWLARGPSYRLPAEMIRDNALAASGLLVQHLGGVSVRPYQPEGLWIEKGNFSPMLLRYKETKGDSLYRRSMYTFIKRSSPHPAMTTFDAPNRDICIIQRENTNTPLQALVLLNDPQFVEAARVLAERMQIEGGEELDEQLNHAFRLATGRHAKAKEIQLLRELYQEQMASFEQEPGRMEELLSVGEYPRNPLLDTERTAALTVVASTVLNCDEAYMKR